MAVLISGNCPFCGQVMMLDVPENAEQREMREKIIARCDCEQAVRVTALKDAGRRISELFGEASMDKGFTDVISRATRGRLNKLCGWVYDGLLDKTSLLLPGGDRATVERKGNRLAVTREHRIKQAM